MKKTLPSHPFARALLCIAWVCLAGQAFALTGAESSTETSTAVAPADKNYSTAVYTQQPDDLWANGRGKDSARWEKATPLFAADLSNADFKPGSWAWENGILVAKGGGDIWTKESFGDVAVMLEFRCEAESNSGVFLRCTDIVDWLQNSIEIQILQGAETDRKHNTGAMYDCLAPSKDIAINAGEWHRFVIVAKGPQITVSLDGQEVTKANLDQWTAGHKNPDGSKNKFDKAYKDMPRVGRLGLQYHGHPIAFRNLFVEKL